VENFAKFRSSLQENDPNSVPYRSLPFTSKQSCLLFTK